MFNFSSSSCIKIVLRYLSDDAMIVIFGSKLPVNHGSPFNIEDQSDMADGGASSFRTVKRFRTQDIAT